MIMNYTPFPGTRDYIACNLCGRPVNMQSVQQVHSQTAHLNLGNTMQPIPPCDVCQQRMMNMPSMQS